jgi:hypothetical protein
MGDDPGMDASSPVQITPPSAMRLPECGWWGKSILHRVRSLRFFHAWLGLDGKPENVHTELVLDPCPVDDNRYGSGCRVILLVLTGNR